MPPSSDGKIVVGFKAQERAVRIAGERRQFCNRRFLGGKVSQETLAICSPVAIFPIPISDVLGTTQHRQVNVFEAGLMERRFQRGFENPACGKRHFANIDDGFNVVVRKQGHEPGEVDAFIADGEDHDDVARFECYEFSRFARLVTKVRGTPQSESRQFSELCISAQRRNPRKTPRMRKLAARAASFCGRCKPRPRPRLQQRHIRRNSQPLGRGGAAASNLDAPEGIRRQPPQAATRMTKGARLGKSGAKAPDRNRGREQPRRARGAAHEATTKLPTKHNTQFNGSEHTQCPPRKNLLHSHLPSRSTRHRIPHPRPTLESSPRQTEPAPRSAAPTPAAAATRCDPLRSHPDS